MNDRSHDTTESPESGFGMIEIVISMFLLTVLAVAFLPVLIQGLKQSAANATLATATQLVHQQIEVARSLVTCTSIIATSDTVIDSRGVSLTVARSVGGSCPLSGYPIAVPVSVSVTRGDTSALVSSASTLVFVAAK